MKLSTRRVGEKVVVVYGTVDGMLQAVKIRRVPQALESYVPLPVRKPTPDPDTASDD